jgi:hypothetical protein
MQVGKRAMCVSARRKGAGPGMKSRQSHAESNELSGELAGLPALGPERLKEQWRTLYGTEPPPRISEDLLRRAIAYRLQERALGGLKPSTRRLLLRVARDARRSRPATPVRKITPGAVLIREWRGTTHQVTVLEDGVLFRGKRHRSLSEVARKITGSRWSGPLFFGLKAAVKENHHGTQ